MPKQVFVDQARKCIQTSQSPFRDLVQLMLKHKFSRNVAKLHYCDGLIQLDLIDQVRHAVGMDGLANYFGNRTNDEGEIRDVETVIEALKRFGASDCEHALSEALRTWQHFVKESSPDSPLQDDATSDELDRLFAVHEDVLSGLESDGAEPIDEYIRRHPEDFASAQFEIS